MGADIEARDENQRTPLHYAMENCEGEVIMVLLDSGANIEAKDKDQNTPLQLAFINCGLELGSPLYNYIAFTSNKKNRAHIEGIRDEEKIERLSSVSRSNSYSSLTSDSSGGRKGSKRKTKKRKTRRRKTRKH